jgi:hypothetical protein
MRPVVDYGMNLPDNLWGLADALAHLYALIAQHPSAEHRESMMKQCKDMERMVTLELMSMMKSFEADTDAALLELSNPNQ